MRVECCKIGRIGGSSNTTLRINLSQLVVQPSEILALELGLNSLRYRSFHETDGTFGVAGDELEIGYTAIARIRSARREGPIARSQFAICGPCFVVLTHIGVRIPHDSEGREVTSSKGQRLLRKSKSVRESMLAHAYFRHCSQCGV